MPFSKHSVPSSTSSPSSASSCSSLSSFSSSSSSSSEGGLLSLSPVVAVVASVDVEVVGVDGAKVVTSVDAKEVGGASVTCELLDGVPVGAMVVGGGSVGAEVSPFFSGSQ